MRPDDDFDDVLARRRAKRTASQRRTLAVSAIISGGLLFSCLVCGLAGLLIGRSGSGLAPRRTLDADGLAEMRDAFQNKQAEPREQYLGRRYVITGKVHHIWPGPDGDVAVQLDESQDVVGISFRPGTRPFLEVGRRYVFTATLRDFQAGGPLAPFGIQTGLEALFEDGEVH